MINTDEIDVLDSKDFTKSFFLKNFISKEKPVLIQGLINGTSADKYWTIENLKNRLGNRTIKVFNVTENNGTNYLFPKYKVKLKEMFLLISTNSKSIYRMFALPLMKRDKKMYNELPCPSFFKCKLQLPGLFFIGGKGSIVPLHYDFLKDNGLLIHFYGRKEVILVDNSQSHLLYKMPLNSTSMVNLFDPDFETFPALRNVKGVKAILSHGDALFIPSGYWHQIKYLDASMSVTFRKWQSNPLKTIATVLKLIVFLSTDKVVNFLQPSKWFKFKQSIAEKRAENFKL